VHVPPGIRTLAIDAEGQVAVRAQAQVGSPTGAGEGSVLGSGGFARAGASVGAGEDAGAGTGVTPTGEHVNECVNLARNRGGPSLGVLIKVPEPPSRAS
jgi:hypothetical protein